MLEKRKIPVSFYVILFFIIMILSYYISGLFTYSDLTFDNIEEHLADIFLHFYQVTRWYNDKTIPILGMGFLGWFFLVYYFMMYYRNFQSDKTHGAEEWADVDEVSRRKRNKDESKNMILSKHIAVDTCGDEKLSNQNVLIFASSGKGKTTGYVIPNILRANDHLFILDVKSDLQYMLGLYLKKMNYTIRSLNMKYPELSDRYNPFAYIENDQDIIRLIENVYDSLEPDDALRNDPFWTDGPKLYMQALFYYEWFDAKENKRNASFNNILGLANDQVRLSNQPPKKKGGQPPSVLEVKMRQKEKIYGPDHPAVRDYFKFIGGAADTVKSIVIIVNAKFKLLELPELKRIFEDDDMHIQDMAYGVGGTKEHPTDKKVAIFLGADDTDPSLNFVFSMFYSQATNILCRIADRDFRDNRGALPIPVGMFMDEFYAGARPANTDVLLGTIRSRNIYMVPILQSKAQLMTLFPNDKWQLFMDNCAVMCFYGAAPAAKETHEWISELAGEMTIDTAVVQKDRTEYGQTGGRLISPAAIKRMPKDDCIIFMEGEFPIYDEKERPWNNPKSPYHEAMALNKASEHGGYVHPVEVVWDEKNYRYITVLPEVETKEFADIDNPEFIHADLRDKPSNIVEALQNFAAITSGQGKRVPTVGTTNDADMTGSFIELWIKYADKLTDEQKQTILHASEIGMPEEALKKMYHMPLEEMQAYLMQWEESQDSD